MSSENVSFVLVFLCGDPGSPGERREVGDRVGSAVAQVSRF